ncbi:hypothetical protein AB6A40_005872 [Gnathostoma spinigerum]|uniref:COMM domain-containing protein 4 n=1 Tax=Gnathostoma spinigerum TaxID=75299 RepID=A0ABD6EGQ6_9BILA
MRFRFNGGLDCPDWVLSEIASLSKLFQSVIKFKVWCSACVNFLLGKRTEWLPEELAKLNPDGSLDESSVRAMIAALIFIFERSSKNYCSDSDLEIEMQQLGFPSEHCKTLRKLFANDSSRLSNVLTADFLRAPSLSMIHHESEETNSIAIHRLTFKDSTGRILYVIMDSSKLLLLEKELKEALHITEPYRHSES